MPSSRNALTADAVRPRVSARVARRDRLTPNRTAPRSRRWSSVENHFRHRVGPDIAHAPGVARTASDVRAIDLADIYVLVVDDHVDTLELFSAALRLFGANVVTART